jgi:hypothetical protein
MLRKTIRSFQSVRSDHELNQITLENSSLENAGTVLDHYGIAVIKDFTDHATLRNLEFISLKLNCINIFSEDLNIKEVENGAFVAQRRNRTFYSKSTCSWRSTDLGMVDIFNPENYPGTSSEELESFSALKNRIEHLIQNQLTFHELRYRWSNLYQYESCITPRPLHIDTLKPQIKAFVALSDVSDLRYGPYSYIPKSHNNQLLNRLSLYLNHFFTSDLGDDVTDSCLYSSAQSIQIFASKGDLILSRNDGVHGDMPASPGFKKSAFVFSYQQF